MPAAAAAQTVPAAPPRSEQRWSVSWGLAGTKNGPASQLEDALRRAHFDDPSPAVWTGTATNPNPRSRGGLFSEVDVTYRHNARLAFGLLRSPSELAWATGYKEPYVYLDLTARATILAPLVYWRIGRNARVGAGPLVAWTELADSGHESVAFKSVKSGALISAVLEGSPWRHTHVAVTTTYRWIPAITAGPFTRERLGIPLGMVPVTRVNLSHVTLGASVGVRF